MIVGLLPERRISDIANGLNGWQPVLGQWTRDLKLARAVEAAVHAAERERCVNLAGELQALRNHVAHWRRADIDAAALMRADDALREWAQRPR